MTNTTLHKHTWLPQAILLLLLIPAGQMTVAQAKLVINGGVINITNGAVLVIDNPDNTAITRNSAGYIRSEAAGNSIVWSIGAGNGNAYVIPFGNAAGYSPVQFKATSGTGNGKFIFSTYPTATWKNSDNLPPGVTNMNKDGIDNSAKTIDRFWQINPQGYTTKPALSNLLFTYAGTEYNAPNTIAAGNFVAQRWNPTLQSWTDYTPASVADSINHTVTINSILGEQVYSWWTLADQKTVVQVKLINFKAFEKNGQVLTIWQTLSEQNIDHFEIWRSKDAVQFEYLGKIASAGNSNLTHDYSFTDPSPYTGISWYKLKIIDKSGGFTWSDAVPVKINKAIALMLYPNPAGNFIIINSNSDVINSKPVVSLFNGQGALLRVFTLSSINQQVNISNLAAGTYQVNISYNNEVKTIRFVKK